VEKHIAPSARSGIVALSLLWLSGACLRLTVLAVPPVVPLLHADLHLSETAIGWLSSLPPMLFAIAAVPGALLIARFGIVPALVVGLLLNAAGSAARAVFSDPAFLYASTIVMAAGVSIMQPSLPPLVRTWFPQRIGFATAVYTTGLLIGEVLAALHAVGHLADDRPGVGQRFAHAADELLVRHLARLSPLEQGRRHIQGHG